MIANGSERASERWQDSWLLILSLFVCSQKEGKLTRQKYITSKVLNGVNVISTSVA